jgi:adenylate cyclase
MRRYRAIFSPNLARSLAAEQNALAHGAERREIATLFTDIAGVTPLVESLDPKQLAELLSGYLEGTTEVVFAHEGTVAKIIGDAIDVLFGALDAHAERYRQEWEARGAPLGVTRIGVHAGLAIVGNFGGGRLYDYTAYGDTIITAARLEAVNKQLGTRICVSAAAAERAEGFVGRPGRRSPLEGTDRAHAGFRAVAARGAQSRRALAYADAFAKLEARDPGALAAFAALVGESPADTLAQYHLWRPLNGESGTRIEMA